MRLLLVTLASVCLLSTFPALAAANASHDGCGESDRRVLVVDVWISGCAGAVYSQPPCFGMTRHEDVDVPGTNRTAHVLILSGWGCQTGAVVGPAA